MLIGTEKSKKDGGMATDRGLTGAEGGSWRRWRCVGLGGRQGGGRRRRCPSGAVGVDEEGGPGFIAGDFEGETDLETRQRSGVQEAAATRAR